MEVLQVTKYAPLEVVKQKDDDKDKRYGKNIEAYVTTFGNEDVVKDVIQEGALDQFVKNFDGKLPMLLNHDVSQIVGVWTKFDIDEYGVKGFGELNETSLGKDVQLLVKDGILSDVSIGFRANDYEYKDDGGRVFKKIELFETSVVLFPANQKANITSVKRDDGSIDMKLLEKHLRDADFSRREAKTIVSGLQKRLRDAEEADTKKQLIANLAEVLKND